jgi:hypothetical protein
MSAAPLPGPLPDLTYGGTSGYSGSTTSKKRALKNDSSGTTGKVQQIVLGWLGQKHTWGMTVAELRDVMSVQHHGSISGALSNMHRSGRISRLTQERGECKIYVLPQYVVNRPTDKPSQHTPWKKIAAAQTTAIKKVWDALASYTPEQRAASTRDWDYDDGWDACQAAVEAVLNDLDETLAELEKKHEV